MTRIEIATRLYAAAISNTELVNQTAEQLRHASIAQADILLAECGEGNVSDCKDCEQTLRQEERATEWADKLANEISSKLNVDIGEHSSSNCPWENALEAIEDYEPTQPRKVEVRLWDSQWSNIVNHPDVRNASTCEGAVASAILMTERKIAENVLNSNLPPTDTQPRKVEVTKDMVKRAFKLNMGIGNEAMIRQKLDYIINGDDQ